MNITKQYITVRIAEIDKTISSVTSESCCTRHVYLNTARNAEDRARQYTWGIIVLASPRERQHYIQNKPQTFTLHRSIQTKASCNHKYYQTQVLLFFLSKNPYTYEILPRIMKKLRDHYTRGKGENIIT